CGRDGKAGPGADPRDPAVLGRVRGRRAAPPAVRRLRAALLLPAAGVPGVRLAPRRVVHRQRPGHAVLLRDQPPAGAGLRGRRAVRDRRGRAGRGAADDDQHRRPPGHARGAAAGHAVAGAVRAAGRREPARIRTSAMTGVIIAGAAETDQIGRLPGHSTLQLHVEGALNAVADAGLSLRDIDGIATVSAPGPVQVAHALGITPRWIDGTGVGGTSFLLHVRHAAAAIRAGYARTVLIAHGESGRSRVGASRYRMEASSPVGQFEVPYGVFGPTTTFTIPLLRYMKEFGLTHEQLAYVAVAQRRWAAKNPRAAYRDPVTVEDVLASRIVAYPFHLPECCLVTDGGGALVVTSAERAGSFPKPAVHVLGTGESSETPMISQMADFTESAAFRLAGRAAFAEARIGVADVDHLMIYDAFAHVPIYGLEALGVTAKGEAGAFIADGNTEPGGSLPLNTNGGGLSYTHTGMYGMFAIQEGVRQLRGEAAAQLDSPEISVILGNGGMFATSGVLVLGRQPRP